MCRNFWASALAVGLIIPIYACPQAKGAAEPAVPARVNISGTWSSGMMGGADDIQLFQEGDRVVGRAMSKGLFIRGTWSEGQLLLILSPFSDQLGGSCDSRIVLVAKTSGTATRLAGMWFDLGSGQITPEMVWARLSPDAGEGFEYPYEAELKNCGQLFTYDLAFETASDQLKGTGWPALAKLAEIMKSDASLKILVAGHTDSTGDAETNQKLSERRAEAVKKILVEKYGADAGRISTRGWGAEQPLADNSTEEGRAINRRVELVRRKQ